MDEHRFQIDLRSLIDLLSNHLYSGPQVYLRELLQNGVDAIRARRNLQPDHSGRIELEVVTASDGPPTLVFVDDGIGLTADELHRFVATIGASSKRDDLAQQRSDFLGQFGIGLLSCFLVSEEIVLITRSATTPGAPTLEWRGRPDGTYSVRELDRPAPIGSQVFLRCRPGREDYFQPRRVRQLATHYGCLLPVPVTITADGEPRAINADAPPWRREIDDPDAMREALLAFGRDELGEEFFDAIPLRCASGGVRGVAFVLPYQPNLASPHPHRVYLRGMLLSEQVTNLVPEWAFFVKCVVDADGLRPTASREALYEDEACLATRDELGRTLRDYLLALRDDDPARLRRFIVLHYLTIKALALRDDELYRLFIDWLPFETTLGEMTLAEIRRRDPGPLRYVPHVDGFRQIAHIAQAQSLCVLNAGYTYDRELLDRFSDVFGHGEVLRLDPADLARGLNELPAETDLELEPFLRAADAALTAFDCQVAVKSFQPAELPTLYTQGEGTHFRRAVERTQEVTDGLWGGLLESVSRDLDRGRALLTFNFDNPLVRKIVRLSDGPLLQRSVQLLYVQALLLGHHPLNADEMQVLNQGLLGLIEWGVERTD
jgi:molecular chaperone HtpG